LQAKFGAKAVAPDTGVGSGRRYLATLNELNGGIVENVTSWYILAGASVRQFNATLSLSDVSTAHAANILKQFILVRAYAPKLERWTP
jgi:hypothetical protein